MPGFFLLPRTPFKVTAAGLHPANIREVEGKTAERLAGGGTGNLRSCLVLSPKLLMLEAYSCAGWCLFCAD